MGIPRTPALTDRARSLRKALTKEERHLWYDFLSAYPVRFHRQRAIGPYVVDFFCPKARLVLELDGSQHYDPAALAYDARRTRYLEDQGLTVLRFTNTDVAQRFDAVRAAIHQAIEEAMT